jgi:DNA-directed RNA polymerase specialized sigma24 family protein
MILSTAISGWLSRLKGGDQAAAQKLWECYFQRLVGVARHKLQGAALRTSDEEDVALSAFASFCRGVERGRFPQLLDRHNLWRLLVVITARKAIRQLEYEDALKRNPEAPAGGGPGSAAEAVVIDQLLGREPTPEFAVSVAEEYQRLLDRLGDDQLRSVAVWKTEGYTNTEIAARLGRTPRCVERKLQVIRSLLEQELKS